MRSAAGWFSRRRSHDDGAVSHELFDLCEQFRTHGFQIRGKHEHLECDAVGECEHAVFYLEVAYDHLGVDMLELVAGRDPRLHHAYHAGSVLADEIGHV